MNNALIKAVCWTRAWLDECRSDVEDLGAVTEETAMRVLLVGAAIAAGVGIALLIEANVKAIPSP